jgi:hypothetical protein
MMLPHRSFCFTSSLILTRHLQQSFLLHGKSQTYLAACFHLTRGFTAFDFLLFWNVFLVSMTFPYTLKGVYGPASNVYRVQYIDLPLSVLISTPISRFQYTKFSNFL